MKSFFIIWLTFLVFVSVGQDKKQVLYGKATYYHQRFEGRKTANGEIFSQKQFTCAHKTLPINTFLKVTNLKNDKTLVLRVNDRLPMESGVLLDLPFIAAKELDFVWKGSTDIRAEIIDTNNVHDSLSVLFAEAAKGMKIEKKKNFEKVISPIVSSKELILVAQQTNQEPKLKQNIPVKDVDSSLTEKKSVTLNYGIQVLSYNSKEKAKKSADLLTKQYQETISVQQKEIKGKMYYRVVIGEYTSKPELQALQSKLAKEYKGCYALALN